MSDFTATSTLTHARTYARSNAHTHPHPHTHARIHAHTHPQTHMHTRTHTYTYTHSHTLAHPARDCWLNSCKVQWEMLFVHVFARDAENCKWTKARIIVFVSFGFYQLQFWTLSSDKTFFIAICFQISERKTVWKKISENVAVLWNEIAI